MLCFHNIQILYIMSYKKGPVPALLTVYKNVITEFITFLKTINNEHYIFIVDNETSDKDCRSIQTIISHIVNSGYGYAHYIRGAISVESVRPEYKIIELDEIEKSLYDIYKYMEDSFIDKEISYDEVDKKIVLTPWNDDLYSIESILEHAVVHILRHKIQIERFIKIINKN